MDGWIDWLSESLIWFIDLLIHGSIDPLYLQWRKSNRNFLAKSSVNNAKWLTTPLICHLYHQWGVSQTYHINHEYHMLSEYANHYGIFGDYTPFTYLYIYIHIYIDRYPIIPYKKPSHLRQTGDPIPFHHVVSPGVWKISEGMMIILVGMMFTMKSKTPRGFQRNINWKGLQTCHN